MNYIKLSCGLILTCLFSCAFPSRGVIKKSTRLNSELAWLAGSIKTEFRNQAGSKSVNKISTVAVRNYLKKIKISDVTLQYAFPDSNKTVANFISSDPMWYDSTLSFGKVVDYGDSTVFEYIVYDESFNPKNSKKSKWDLKQVFWLNDSVRLERHVLYLVVVH